MLTESFRDDRIDLARPAGSAVETRIVCIDQFDCREDLRSRVYMPQYE
jgi:hypothetical protein